MVARKPHASSASTRFLSLLFILLIVNVHLNLVLGIIPLDTGKTAEDGLKAVETPGITSGNYSAQSTHNLHVTPTSATGENDNADISATGTSSTHSFKFSSTKESSPENTAGSSTVNITDASPDEDISKPSKDQSESQSAEYPLSVHNSANVAIATDKESTTKILSHQYSISENKDVPTEKLTSIISSAKPSATAATMSSRGETVSKPTSTTELSSSATPKNTDTDARPSSASPSASVSPSPSLETESHEPTKDVNGDHSSTSKVSSASALASESASSNHSDTSADQPDSTKSVSGKVSATTKPASSTIFRSTITPAATLPRNPAGSKTFSISSSSKHTSASHHETDLYSSTRSTGTHTHTMSHAPPHRSSYASGSHVSSSSRVSRSHASSSHASSSRAVISHISAHVPQGTNSLHLSNASPSSHTTVISSVSGSKVNSHHGSKTSSHVSSATSAPSHSMQSSSHSKPTPPQTTNELTTTTTTTTTTATTTTTTSDAVETTSEPTTSITQTKSHSPSPYHYQTYSWLSNTFSIALSTTTSKPTSSQSSYKASETLHPSSSPSDTDTTDDNLPQYIAPNINAEIPDTSDLVNMKFNYLSYPQMVQDALLTAEFVQALPVLISKVLDISEDDVIIVTITSGSQQSGKKKRQTTDSTGVIVSMAIPSTEVTELQTLVASSDSSLYAASNGQLASLIDSSYKITSSSVASTANTPVVSDPNSGSVESSEASSQPDQQKSGLSKGSIIGICVSVGAIVYAAATVIVVKKIRHRKRQIQEPPMVDQHVFARSISAPISQGNSLGWSNNRSPPEPLPHPSYYQQW